jgi:hypothetical protein
MYEGGNAKEKKDVSKVARTRAIMVGVIPNYQDQNHVVGPRPETNYEKMAIEIMEIGKNPKKEYAKKDCKD